MAMLPGACFRNAGVTLPRHQQPRERPPRISPPPSAYSISELVPAMKYDKKAEGEGVNFVLIHAVGDVRIEKLPVFFVSL